MDKINVLQPDANQILSYINDALTARPTPVNQRAAQEWKLFLAQQDNPSYPLNLLGQYVASGTKFQTSDSQNYISSSINGFPLLKTPLEMLVAAAYFKLPLNMPAPPELMSIIVAILEDKSINSRPLIELITRFRPIPLELNILLENELENDDTNYSIFTNLAALSDPAVKNALSTFISRATKKFTGETWLRVDNGKDISKEDAISLVKNARIIVPDNALVDKLTELILNRDDLTWGAKKTWIGAIYDYMKEGFIPTESNISMILRFIDTPEELLDTIYVLSDMAVKLLANKQLITPVIAFLAKHLKEDATLIAKTSFNFQSNYFKVMDIEVTATSVKEIWQSSALQDSFMTDNLKSELLKGAVNQIIPSPAGDETVDTIIRLALGRIDSDDNKNHHSTFGSIITAAIKKLSAPDKIDLDLLTEIVLLANRTDNYNAPLLRRAAIEELLKLKLLDRLAGSARESEVVDAIIEGGGKAFTWNAQTTATILLKFNLTIAQISKFIDISIAQKEAFYGDAMQMVILTYNSQGEENKELIINKLCDLLEVIDLNETTTQLLLNDLGNTIESLDPVYKRRISTRCRRFISADTSEVFAYAVDIITQSNASIFLNEENHQAIAKHLSSGNRTLLRAGLRLLSINRNNSVYLANHLDSVVGVLNDPDYIVVSRAFNLLSSAQFTTITFDGLTVSYQQFQRVVNVLANYNQFRKVRNVIGALFVELCKVDNPEDLMQELYELVYDTNTNDVITKYGIFTTLYSPKRIFYEATHGTISPVLSLLSNQGLYAIEGDNEKVKSFFYPVIAADLAILSLWGGNELLGEYTAEFPLPVREQLERVLLQCGGDLTLEAQAKFQSDVKSQANAKNRQFAEGLANDSKLPHKVAIKAMNSKILATKIDYALFSKEFSLVPDSDRTPFDTDAIVLDENLSLRSALETSSAKIDKYGDIVLMIDYDEADKATEAIPSKVISPDHVGFRTGIPITTLRGVKFLSAINQESLALLKIKSATKYGFYLPIFDQNNNLLFTPEEYESIKNTQETEIIVSGALGSNAGHKYIKLQNGEIEVGYRKFTQNSPRAINEVTITDIYKTFGLPVPVQRIYRNENNVVLESKWVDGFSPSAAHLVSASDWNRGFLIDCWTANWDIPAAPERNVSETDNGEIYRIDNGGGGLYRARGDRKDKFPSVVIELETIRKQYPSLSDSQLFTYLNEFFTIFTDEVIENLIQAKIDELNSSAAQSEDLAKFKQELKDGLIRRREFIREYFSARELQTSESLSHQELVLLDVKEDILSDNHDRAQKRLTELVVEWQRLNGPLGYQHNKVLLGSHIYDVIVNVVQDPRLNSLSIPDQVLVIEGALFHDLGKPTGAKDEDVERDYGHNYLSAEIASEYAEKWGLPAARILRLVKLIIYDGVASDAARGKSEKGDRDYLDINEFQSLVGTENLQLLRILNRADGVSVVGASRFAQISDKFETYFN